MEITNILVRLSNGDEARWSKITGEVCSPSPIESSISIEDCLKNKDVWDAIANLAGGTSNFSDMEAIAYWIVSFTAVSIVGLLFHGFFVWLIAMFKPS